MTPERWQEIEHVLRAVLALPGHSRESAVADLCGGDETLRHEVEALLAHAGAASAFLETPAFTAASAAGAPLFVGRRFGSYVVRAPLGAGGMGEVYRAHDDQLGRDVAIKILAPLRSNDGELLARFEGEARMLATLNHPHIGAIYGLEHVDAIPVLILELVEGETLAERIAKGPVPLSEAIAIATQITNALEAAHDRGIVHRDLKPTNIKVTPDGTVKVLDFGLAKLVRHAGGWESDATRSPTIVPSTRDGVIVGTVGYMSPEQARGIPVDRRADIWAFGCVMFEMLTGRQAFAGETATDTLAAIVDREPPWTMLPPGTPASVRRLLRRCLDKDPKHRLSSMGDARLELDDAAGPAERDGAPVAAVVRPAWHRLSWAVAGVFALTLVGALLIWSPWRSARELAPRQLLANIGADASLATETGASVILSPDGTTLAFVAGQTGQQRLFVRRLDQLRAIALAGTEHARSPFFSPDGQSIGFFAVDKLKRVSVAGGASVELCDAPLAHGGTWTDDDTIIFAKGNSPLMRVPAAGGTASVSGTLSEGAKAHYWPQALPGGMVMYTEHSEGDDFDSANIVVAPLAGGTSKVVVRGGYFGRYLESAHVIYMQRGRLFSVGFDLVGLETSGPPVQALEGISANPNLAGYAQLAVSPDGTLVYVPGATTSTATSIDWLTRDGTRSTLRATKADWANPAFSPDGQKLALEIFDGKQNNIWVYDWARDSLAQLTDAGSNRYPAWTPDGRRIVFSAQAADAPADAGIYWVDADGTGEATRLSDPGAPWSWHPGGRFLAFMINRGPPTETDLWILPMEGDAARGWTPGKAIVFLDTPANTGYPVFSPDGRWIAYFSNEAGTTYDVYVRPFPGPGGKWRVSTEGGRFPRWSATTNELLFVDRSGTVLSVTSSSAIRFEPVPRGAGRPAASKVLPGGTAPTIFTPTDNGLRLWGRRPAPPSTIRSSSFSISSTTCGRSCPARTERDEANASMTAISVRPVASILPATPS